MTAKMATIVKKIKGFPLKVKSFRNTATYQKQHTPSPPPRLYHSVGMNLRVRPRVNGNSKSCFGIRPVAFAKKWPQKLGNWV